MLQSTEQQFQNPQAVYLGHQVMLGGTIDMGSIDSFFIYEKKSHLITMIMKRGGEDNRVSW